MQSPLTQMSELQTNVLVLLRQRSEGKTQQVSKQIQVLRRELGDARLDIRDSEFADTNLEYRRHVAEAQVRLAHILKLVLELSQHDIFSAIEIAELGARLEVIGRAL